MIKDIKIAVRSKDELELIKKSGLITAKALKKTINNAKLGVSLKDLEKIADGEIKLLGGESAFKTVEGYFYTTCLCVNDEVVHGIPRDIILKEGDLLSIDLGSIYQGWYTDAAWSVLIQGKGKREKGEKEKFLKVGEEALWKAIDQAIEGNRIGDISAAIQEIIEGANYSVVRTLIGHGVGQKLHEPPEIPGIGMKGTGPILKSGNTLAIEVIYTSGKPDVLVKDDGWTVVTKDGSLGGLFEMSIIVGREKSEILTDWRRV